MSTKQVLKAAQSFRLKTHFYLLIDSLTPHYKFPVVGLWSDALSYENLPRVNQVCQLSSLGRRTSQFVRPFIGEVFIDLQVPSYAVFPHGQGTLHLYHITP